MNTFGLKEFIITVSVASVIALFVFFAFVKEEKGDEGDFIGAYEYKIKSEDEGILLLNFSATKDKSVIVEIYREDDDNFNDEEFNRKVYDVEVSQDVIRVLGHSFFNDLIGKYSKNKIKFSNPSRKEVGQFVFHRINHQKWVELTGINESEDVLVEKDGDYPGDALEGDSYHKEEISYIEREERVLKSRIADIESSVLRKLEYSDRIIQMMISHKEMLMDGFIESEEGLVEKRGAELESFKRNVVCLPEKWTISIDKVLSDYKEKRLGFLREAEINNKKMTEAISWGTEILKEYEDLGDLVDVRDTQKKVLDSLKLSVKKKKDELVLNNEEFEFVFNVIYESCSKFVSNK